MLTQAQCPCPGCAPPPVGDWPVGCAFSLDPFCQSTGLLVWPTCTAAPWTFFHYNGLLSFSTGVRKLGMTYCVQAWDCDSGAATNGTSAASPVPPMGTPALLPPLPQQSGPAPGPAGAIQATKRQSAPISVGADVDAVDMSNSVVHQETMQVAHRRPLQAGGSSEPAQCAVRGAPCSWGGSQYGVFFSGAYC